VRTQPDNSGAGRDHGPHTLKVWSGTVVGVYGDDVFVELGPRMQGVISRRAFAEPPREGERFDFTLRGQEDGLWALARVEERPLASWDAMEVGSVVHARVTGRNDGGLELKIGPLHAFMPRSQTGLPRGTDRKVLVGKTLAVEVVEVDAERQRVLVSRKVLLERERADERQRDVHALEVGQIVRGRVTRIEEYGAFVAFGTGLEGLVHVSNLSYDPVRHPADLVRVGQPVEAKVLAVRRAGRRIALGMKQMGPSPWRDLERRVEVGDIVEGRATRAAGMGVFVAIERGVEGLLHESQSGLGPGQRLADVVREGQTLAVRVVSLDVEGERLSLSLLHEGGARIRPEEAAGLKELRERRLAGGLRAAATNLGKLLERALKHGGATPRPASPERS
jgi:small subunit ribosomal protein S1